MHVSGMLRGVVIVVAVMVGASGCSSERKAATHAAPPPTAPARVEGAPVTLPSTIAAPLVQGMPAPTGPYRGPDCQAAYAPVPDRDPSPMCFEPGGSYLMGSPDGEGGPAEHPQQKVTLSPFFIDQFEVTRAQFTMFLNDNKHGLKCNEIGPDMCPPGPGEYAKSTETRDWAIDVFQNGKLLKRVDDYVPSVERIFSARKGEERMPMDDVSPLAADAYCAWAGKILPTNAQWEYAARVEPLTGQTRRYPWGNNFSKTAARCLYVHCPLPKGKLASWMAPIDEYPNDKSATGVRGLGGNADEWVRECATTTIPLCGDCVDPVEVTACSKTVFVDANGWESVPGGRAIRGGDIPETMRGSHRDPISSVEWRGIGLRCSTPIAVAATEPKSSL